MRVVRALPLAAALAFALAGPAAAQSPAPTLDAEGGAMCRPHGGGTADCTSQGQQVGEYRCRQEPCTSKLQALKLRFCLYGQIVPVRSTTPRGEFPTGTIQRPVRVDRRTSGHILVTDRRTEPALVAPGDCKARDPAFRISATSITPLDAASAGAAPRDPDEGAVHGSAWWLVPAALAGAARRLLVRFGSHSYWQARAV